ncbi:hypothetical protein YC2023_001638 [Brassica napus]
MRISKGSDPEATSRRDPSHPHPSEPPSTLTVEVWRRFWRCYHRARTFSNGFFFLEFSRESFRLRVLFFVLAWGWNWIREREGRKVKSAEPEGETEKAITCLKIDGEVRRREQDVTTAESAR